MNKVFVIVSDELYPVAVLSLRLEAALRIKQLEQENPGRLFWFYEVPFNEAIIVDAHNPVPLRM